MTVVVQSAGFLSTVQDLGRTGFRQHGVPLSGALDPHALAVANTLVGNASGAAGLEISFGHVRLRFADQRLVAWCGGDFAADIGDEDLQPGHVATVAAGGELHIAASSNGGRAWLAISGGIDVRVVLGSRSTDLRSKFGGLDGRALVDGDVLPLGRSEWTNSVAPVKSGWFAPNEWCRTAPHHNFLRIVPGADWGRFGADGAVLLAGTFTVTTESDRMGVRLEGTEVARADGEELVSEAVVPGTIQIPPDGNPIVLLGDCQTIGGYPKIAHVITVDLPAAAQLSPGATVRFAEGGVAEAQRLLMQRQRDFGWFRAGVALKLR